MDMYRLACAGLLLAALPAATAQESLPASVCATFDLYVALPGELVPLLQEAQDRESADRVAGKLRAFLPRLYEARSAIEQIPRLSPAATAELERRYGHRAQVGWGAVYKEIFRLQKNQCFGSTLLAKEFNILCMMLK